MNRYEANVSPLRIPATMSKKSVSIRWENFDLRVFIEHDYGCDNFIGETIGYRYFLHVPYVNEVKCQGEIYK